MPALIVEIAWWRPVGWRMARGYLAGNVGLVVQPRRVGASEDELAELLVEATLDWLDEVYAELEETSRNVVLAAMLNRAVRPSDSLLADQAFKGLVRLLQLPALRSFAS